MNRSSFRSVRLALVLGVHSLIAIACTSSEPLKPVFPARGQVFFDGKPAAGTLVVLHPLNDPTPNPLDPRAVVESDGTFVVSTHNAHDGAPPGRYALTVHNLTPESEVGSKPLPAAGTRLPPRYANPQSSGLEVEIHPRTNDIPPLRLTR